jgi:hypothetical protein
MKKQLTLITSPRLTWRLNEKTKATGFAGIAQARDALATAQRKNNPGSTKAA